jgi:hypothetical protein
MTAQPTGRFRLFKPPQRRGIDRELDSLWGELPDPKVDTKTSAPKRILEEQGQILSDKYNHLLEGEVDARSVRDRIVVSLYIVVPTLNNYRVLITRAHQGVLSYPPRLKTRLGVQNLLLTPIIEMVVSESSATMKGNSALPSLRSSPQTLFIAL